MKDQKFRLTEDPIPYLVIKMAVPVSIGFFFHTMFNVVDTYFASKINSVAVAAITITFPIFFMIIAISSGTRQGATALIANAEGSNNKILAKKYLLQTVSTSNPIFTDPGFLSTRIVHSSEENLSTFFRLL